MYDKPQAQGILEAVRHHLESAIVPAVKADGGLYYQTLIAINMLKIAERELSLYHDHIQQEWADLNTVLNLEEPMPRDQSIALQAIAARQATLVELIERGDYDGDAEASLLTYLQANTRRQLEVIGKG